MVGVGDGGTLSEGAGDGRGEGVGVADCVAPPGSRKHSLVVTFKASSQPAHH